jgi:DNA-binding NarL/FixJ family response regulator
LFLTAYADQNTLEKAKQTMPYGYILKPFNETGLRVNLEMALFKHRAEKNYHTISKPYIESTYETSLSDREYRVLEAFVKGFSYKKTAEKCCISVNTVKSHQKKLYQIFGVKSKAGLVQKLLQH